MRAGSGLRWALAVATTLLTALAGCGENSSETTITGGGNGIGQTGPVVSIDVPTGPNTTEIVVDSGPASGFSLGVSNIPYVTVTVCSPGSSTDCVTIDHVLLDTGSVGFRVLKSVVAPVPLSPVMLPADAASQTPAGPAVECFPFVIGALWGPLKVAAVHIAGETADNLPIQIIDDSAVPEYDSTNCVAASNGGLLDSMTKLQAKGVLGVGMIRYDCGAICVSGNYAGGYTLYSSCPSTPTSCVPAAIPGNLQVQNPVVYFPVNNNGTIINLPGLPQYGASVAKGRLVFGIGTQSNNQIPLTAKIYPVDNRPSSLTYLYLSTAVGAKTYPYSYIDSGSNAFFFDDPSISTKCQSSSGTVGGWYCPAVTLPLSATVTDMNGASGPVSFSIANADVLFLAPNMALANLGGSAGQGTDTFVWGLPFFFGRSVFTSIWGQTLSSTGPWFAF